MHPQRLLSAFLSLFCLTILLQPSRLMALAEIEIIRLSDNVTLVDGATVTDFGNVAIGSTKTIQFRVNNLGDVPLGVSDYNFSDTGADDYSNTTIGAATVAAGANRTFTITFRPTAGGQRQAVMSLVNTDTNEFQFDFILTGNGTGPDIKVQQGSKELTSGNTVFFSNISPGGLSFRNFSISNSGTSTLTISGVTVTGSTFSYSGTVPGSLAAGQSFDVSVRWNPVVAGPASGSLRITSGDPDESPFIVNLSGTALDPGIGDMDDPDGDGIVNLIEDATGTSRTEPNGPAGTLSLEGGYAYFTYNRAVGSGITLTVEVAESAEAMANGWTVTSGTEIVQDFGTYHTVIFVYTPTPGPFHFVRLRASR